MKKNWRECEACGVKMAQYAPRKKMGDRFLCPECARKAKTEMTAVRKVAHDSGDGMSIYHCPFCGSGQVIARSDGTVECQFCHTAFTVQVQPQYPAFPQTINGMPVQVPGMPGQIGGPPGVDPMDPGALDENGEPIEGEGGIPGEEAPSGDEEAPPGDEEDGGGGDGPPWEKKSYRTAQGFLLSQEEYLHHVAIKTSPDPRRTALMIRESRKA